MVIRTPPAWGWDQVTHAARSIGSASPDQYWPQTGQQATRPAVRRLHVADLRDALARGFGDFGAYRTDVIFLCVVYPLVGLLLARLAFGYELLPLLFPLASGFALIGPFAAVGLNEMSRRRELTQEASFWDAFAVFRSPAFGKIIVLGAVLVALFLLWLVAAQLIYEATLGPKPPVSAAQFAHDVLRTEAGWMMIAAGVGVGFLFAVLVLSISVVAFPMLLDRNVSIETAVRTSVLVVAANPLTMAVWGLIIAAGLVLGSIPLLLGLVVVMPVPGHATWHLYRRAVQV
jgi:uncharacterized membrane protein